MPKGDDWIKFLYVTIAFIVQILLIFYVINLADIKKNWPKYRCNPMYMAFADNIEQNFVYCIQNSQSNYMGFILTPINYLLSTLGSFGGEIIQIEQSIRMVITNSRNFMAMIVKELFGVFLNLVIEIQRTMIEIKDMMAKVMGVVTTLLYLLDGSSLTAQSMWNGPAGDATRILCFSPETKVKLANEKVVKMKDLNLGDILENGSRVDGILKLKNTGNEDYYVFKNKGVDKSDIYVTSRHMVYDNKNEKFVQVRDHPDSLKPFDKSVEDYEKMSNEWFSCLITNDHKIRLGEYEFWDWEDDIFKYGRIEQ